MARAPPLIERQPPTLTRPSMRRRRKWRRLRSGDESTSQLTTGIVNIKQYSSIKSGHKIQSLVAPLIKLLYCLPYHSGKSSASSRKPATSASTSSANNENQPHEVIDSEVVNDPVMPAISTHIAPVTRKGRNNSVEK